MRGANRGRWWAVIPPRNASRGLPSPPEHGIHGWLLSAANSLRHHHHATECAQILGEQCHGARRHVPTGEVQAAVRKAFSDIGQTEVSFAMPRTFPTTAGKWPAVGMAAREKVVTSGFTLADLWEASPVRMDEIGPGTEDIIDALFPGDPLLCCGASKTAAVTNTRESFRGRLADLQLIVPSPMAALTGQTQDGKQSPRCLDNTGPRRYLVVECDSGTVDEQAAILSHMSDHAPLVLAVHSGGKSLHGWFRAHAEEQVTRKFFNHAVKLGADPATWCRCQFVRMPGGVRDNGARQVVWFFNPPSSNAN